MLKVRFDGIESFGNELDREKKENHKPVSYLQWSNGVKLEQWYKIFSQGVKCVEGDCKRKITLRQVIANYFA